MSKTIKSDGNISITSTSGVVTITGASASIFNGDLTVTGDFNVQGSSTTVSTTNTTIKDNIIVLNQGESGAGVTSLYSGIEIDRGSLDNVQIRWNETSDVWQLTTDGSTFVNIATTTGGVFLENIVEDTTPQLGGDLDVNGNDIVSVSNGNINIIPHGNGNLIIGNGNLLPASSSAIQNLGSPTDYWTNLYSFEVIAANITGLINTSTQPNITSLGTLSSLDVDNLNLNGNTISSTSGALTITPAAGSALNLDDSNFTVDSGVVVITGQLGVDNLSLNGNVLSSTDSNGNITLTPNGSGATQGRVIISTNTALTLPTGTTAERPGSPSAGDFRYNTSSGNVEYSDGGSWTALIGISTNTISQGDSSVTVTDAGSGSIGITVDSSNIADYTASGLRLGAAGARVTTILDEDTMSSDSATALATQQSIKAYVDTEISGIAAITAGNSNVTVTDAGSGSIVVTVDGSSIGDYTASGLRLGGANARVTTILDEDTMSSDSATALATQQSIKAYVDTEISGISTIQVGDTSMVITDTGSDGTITFKTDNVTVLTLDNSQSSTFAGDVVLTSGDVLPSASSVIQNLGSASDPWTNGYINEMHGVATSAQYADLAENFVSDDFYVYGTVVSFGGTEEITESLTDHDTRIAGVISTNPAYLMNSAQDGEFVLPLALSGRVPCKVEGVIKKGDMLVSAGNGRARAEQNPKLGSIIGKALEDFNGIGYITIVVGRL